MNTDNDLETLGENESFEDANTEFEWRDDATQEELEDWHRNFGEDR